MPSGQFAVAFLVAIALVLAAALLPVPFGLALLTRVRTRWREARASTGSLPATGRSAPNAHVVAAPYSSLNSYLEGRYASQVVMTFEQVEWLLGVPLPAIARTDITWWTSGTLALDAHADAWIVAGRTAIPNLSACTVTFNRSS